MKIIGFNFTKINVKKEKDSFNNLKITNHADILDIKEVKQEIFKSEEGILVAAFSYVVEYSPDIARIELEGKILLSLDQKTSKEILKGWKTKTTQDDFKIFVFNVIFRKAGLKALELEDEMSLPLHISMPSFSKK